MDKDRLALLHCESSGGKSLKVTVYILFVANRCITCFAGLGFSSSSQWDLMGTAVVTPDHVRLTPDLQSRQGAVWSRIVSLPTHSQGTLHYYQTSHALLSHILPRSHTATLKSSH